LIDFGERVDGFQGEDIQVTNGRLPPDNPPVSSFRPLLSFAQYYIFVEPDADGLLTVHIPAGVAQDQSGNPNLAATYTKRVERSAPFVFLEPPSTRFTIGAPFIMRFSFSEPVTGLTLEDFVVNNARVTNLAPNQPDQPNPRRRRAGDGGYPGSSSKK